MLVPLSQEIENQPRLKKFNLIVILTCNMYMYNNIFSSSSALVISQELKNMCVIYIVK